MINLGLHDKMRIRQITNKSRRSHCGADYFFDNKNIRLFLKKNNIDEGFLLIVEELW